MQYNQLIWRGMHANTMKVANNYEKEDKKKQADLPAGVILQEKVDGSSPCYKRQDDVDQRQRQYLLFMPDLQKHHRELYDY